MILPSSSQIPPVNGRDGFRSHGLKQVTAWGAVVWTYADEIAYAASTAPAGRWGGIGYVTSGLGRERIGAGAINGWYEPAADALLIHAKLTAWFAHDGEGLACVIRHAERRVAVPPVITVPRLRAVPVTDRRGEVLVKRLRAHRLARVQAEYCEVDFEGVPAGLADAREEAWRAFHAMLVAFLDVMPGFGLQRLRVEGRGLAVDTVCESLT